MTDREALDRAADVLGPLACRGAALGPLTTYRVGGPAALLATVGTDRDLDTVAGAVAVSGLDVLCVGKGSNLLVADAGFGGIAVVLGEGFADVSIDVSIDVATVRAGGGAGLPVVARRTAAAGLTGFEWAVGVPGSVGGAVRMNAGGHGSDMAANLTQVRLRDLYRGHDGVVPADALGLGYRRSNIDAGQIVCWADLELAVGDRGAAEAEVAEIVRWRRANQPGGRNAGSVFTNPPGDSAGRLIDAAGCRGLRLRTAEVSTKHANFIQADERGSADDVHALMLDVRRRVEESCGIDLHPETVLVGFGGSSAPAR